MKAQSLALASLVIALTAAAVALGAGLLEVRASRPELNGERTLKGLSAPVDVPRDKFGVPTIIAATRIDAARALGFVHAQERFFQMDLLRRSAAGELAELFGAAALPRDRAVRIHRFRARAALIFMRSSAADQALLVAYSDGVNKGLEALGARPFEYLLLRSQPATWQPADSYLVNYNMFLSLNDKTGSRDRETGALRDSLGLEVANWLTPRGSPADAALDGSLVALAPLPGAESLDLRAIKSILLPLLAQTEVPDTNQMVGSNSFALAAARSRHGGAILANDMHLGLSVPTVWFRARLRYALNGRQIDATGVTLPGTPAVVAGSNGQVAWGFTNSYVDLTDLVRIERDPQDDGRWLGADGQYKPFVRHLETLRIKGEPEQQLTVLETDFGPLLPATAGQPEFALRWAAHADDANTLGLDSMIAASTVSEAIAVCQAAGMPPQNIALADRAGNVAWTLCGRIPAREPSLGAAPMSAAEAARAWNGWLSANAVPRLIDPPDGRIWTANARTVGGESAQALGDGDYDYGARAAQIRDRLRERDAFSEADLYAIQLDDEARYLKRWQTLLASQLNQQQLAERPELEAFLRLSQSTKLHAESASVAYTLLREFRLKTLERAFKPFLALVKARHPDFSGVHLRQREALVWQLLEARPAHLLDPRFASWDALLIDAIDAARNDLRDRFGSLDGARYGLANQSAIRHPLSAAEPILGPWLDMPVVELDGDAMMPRVQQPAFGASERFVVSPGREAEGIFTLAGGQSGHPLSPYYRRGFSHWARGEAAPFLPMQARYRLVLNP